MYQRTPEAAKQAARELRRNQTESEAKLWNVLRNRRFFGKKFLRQHPVIFPYQSRKRFFVADFYCHEAGLVVEIDGKIHDFQKDYDRLRTHIMNELGMKVVRFRNEQIDTGMEEVLEKLHQMMKP